MSQEKAGIDNPGYDVTSGDLNEAPQNGTLKNGLPADSKGPPADPKPTEEKEREQWGHGLEFLMSCIAMSVGLGNIWRFPFTAYENGGGAFLVPYIIVLILVGRPLYYLEMALGQFSSKGTVKMYGSLGRALKGIGYGQLIGSCAVATYYCSLMAVTLFYFVNSFTADLPWATCWPEWEEEGITCVPSRPDGNEIVDANNTISSAELFFTREVLREITDITDGIGIPDWRLTLCLFVAWLITFAMSVRGVKSSGKAAYFLAIFPYVIMIALLIRAVTLEGAGTGVAFFFQPDWSKLLEAQVWYAAVTQCFFSLSVGFGAIIMYSSYNSFDQNINRDSFIVTTLDTFTSLLSGCTIFAVLGNLAHEMGVEVDEVVRSGGSGIAFISYPDAIAKFDSVPWLFAILFFGMLFILGVGSLMGLHNCANTAIKDAFPNLKSWVVAATTAIIGFLFGLVYVTPGGQFILNLVDHFGGTFIIIILVIFELAAVAWLYGLQNFCDDMLFMLKSKVGLFWRFTWGIITPVLVIIIFVYFVATLERLTYGPHEYPDHIMAWGWVILGVTMGQVAMWFAYYTYVKRRLGFPEMVIEAFSSEKWRPKREVHYQEWVKFKAEKQREREAKNDPFFIRILKTLIGR